MIITSTKPPYDYEECKEFIDRLKSRDPDLLKEYNAKYGKYEERYAKAKSDGRKAKKPVNKEEELPETTAELENIQALRPESIVAHFRPVLIIRDNQIVPEFVGAEVDVWKDRLMNSAAVLNSVIPSVGRIEVSNNALYTWVGTGWLVDTDIIVTNRHVATIFSRNKTGFSFKIGFPTGNQAAKLDFLEEHQRSNSLEFDVDSVLWMSENNGKQPDVAFLKLKGPANGLKFPKPISLAKTVDEGAIVVTIGYPARDPDFPNQELELKVFKNVFDKKRLAPGEVLKVSDTEVEHDCSTLGGNSGSAVINLATGEALGLHFAGVFMRANYAVPATKISELLSQLKNKTLPGMTLENPDTTNIPGTKPQVRTTPAMNAVGAYSFELNVPIRITVEVGGAVMQGTVQLGQNALPAGSATGTIEEALEAARTYLRDWPDIIDVRKGYRFRRGWITDEEVIVVEVREKKSLPDLRKTGTAVIPQQFLGFGVEVRSADLLNQLEDLGLITMKEEAAPSAGAYREPPDLKLEPVKAKMKAIFHVSPDSGFPNLKKFFDRIGKKLTATMYEWEVNHVSDALFNAISSANATLKMVTQIAGTREAVENMKQRLGAQFEHQWASVGKNKLIPKAYHIKVATRDRKEFWLSSGNWKNSNQSNIDPAGENSKAITPLREKNREWHVIIENEKLARIFEDYINWDFKEAQRVPVEEALEAPPVWLMVPDVILERRAVAKYFDPLVLDRELDIQPLLTPDRDDRGRRMFMVFATALIERATSAIFIENQSFALLDDNNEAFERFFTVLRNKQEEGIQIQIIFRDAREFPGNSNNVKTLEHLKRFGMNMDNIKVQVGCHTKAIIIDPDDDEKATVLFGSHNLTNTGALFNRDASLLVKDAEVARYFKQIFDFDWETLAEQDLGDATEAVRIAAVNEVPPAGFKKVLLSTLLDEI